MNLCIKLIVVLIFLICIFIIQEANGGIFFNRKPIYSIQVETFNNRIKQQTWPGDLKQHLRIQHNINTDGMSFQQMKYLHNVLHESER